MHMQVMEAPDIRWSVLASEGGEENDEEGAPGDEHTHEHTGYDLEGFRLAVVEGKHPNGDVTCPAGILVTKTWQTWLHS